MHHLPREILRDGESDHVRGGSCVGDDPAYLSTGEPAGLYAQPQHDFVAVDGVNVEMDRHPCTARGGQPAQQRPLDSRSSSGLKEWMPHVAMLG
jgi:hypothetical protein